MPRIEGTAEQFIANADTTSIADTEKALFVRFFQRFPSVTFYRYAERAKELPTWLQVYDQVVAGFFPGQLQWMLFHEDSQVFPYTTLFTEKEYWYNFGLSKTLSSEHDEIFLEGVPLLIVATYPKTLDSILVVKFDTDVPDKQVYEFGLEQISKNTQGQWQVTDAHVAFESYAAMFDAIIAVRGENNPAVYGQGE